MILLKKVKKSFTSTLVLEIEEIKLEAGIYWLKGENGSGKSTFLRIIAGIIDFEGEILLDEKLNPKIQKVDYRKLINFAEAEPIFPEFLTGNELIALFKSAKNAPSKQVEYYLDSMKMNEFVNEQVGSYSSGMLKKLSLLLAFLGNPQLILLDEPLITLDVESLKILYQWIEEKYLSENISFLISSHQALDISSKVPTKTLEVKNKTIMLQ